MRRMKDITGGENLLRIETVTEPYLKHPLELSVERRADSPGCWKDRENVHGME